MKSLFPPKFHFYIYILGLLMLSIGLPLSKYLMSLSQLILLGNWILEGELKRKFSDFWKNRPALVLSSLIMLHFLGLIYTSDFAYALNDVRIKIPLLVFPLIISTSKPFSKKIFEIILQVFVAATILATIISCLILTDVVHREILDIRKISIFISHIRFGLLICIGIFISGYFVYNRTKIWMKFMWTIIIGWFIFFLILMESLTGLSILCFTVFILICYFIFTSKYKLLKIGGLTLIAISILGCFYYVNMIENENKPKEVFSVNTLEWRTKKGNVYGHNINNKQTENGHYVWMYFCMKELETAWNRRSEIKFSEKDLKGNDIRFTLMRFLTSKGLRKDEEGVKSLSDEEVRSIDRGAANVNYQNISSLRGRLHETLWEINLYKTTGDPNGHSLTQRFEYWKTAFNIIKEHPLIGVGTGDIEMAFNEQYDKMNSPLEKEWRLRSHNQYLSITVAFGLIGLIWFLITLIYPMIKQKMMFDYLYITFFIVAVISFLNEDTLETQAGVTFYVFFNSFFLFAGKNTNENLDFFV